MHKPFKHTTLQLKSVDRLSAGPGFRAKPSYGGGVSNELKNLRDETKTFTDEIKSLSDTIPSVKKSMQLFGSTFTDLKGSIDGAQAGLGALTGMLKKSADVMITMTKTVTAFERMNAKLNKSFKMGSEAAAVMGNTLRANAKDLKIGDDKLQKFAGSLKGMTGGFISSTKVLGKFGKELLQTQTYIQNNLGLSEESAQKFELYAQGLGKSGAQAAGELSKMTKAMSDSTGLDATQMQAQIIEDITAMGADLVFQYGRVPGELEKATMKARILGTSLEQLNTTGTNMLNIESSIGSELEYQQLTGKRLLDQNGKSLTNEYRMATLKGDATKQAELMEHFLEEEGDNLENNMLARKKAAELFQMSEADLMRMRQQQKLVSKLEISDIMKEAEGDLDVVKKKMEAQGFQADDIQDVIAASDTRTTDERMEDHLKAIRANLVGDKFRGKEDQVTTDRTALEKILPARQEQYVENIKDADSALGEISVGMESFKVAIQPALTGLEMMNKLTGKFGQEISSAATNLSTIIKVPVADIEEGASAVGGDGGLATGGFVSGPGSGTSDSIPARLSDGEYVINAASTKKYRPLLDKINKNPARMAAGGGPMMSTNKMETLLSGILQAIKTSDFNFGSKQI